MTRRGYYGQKYLEAETEEDLLSQLGEACCVSAVSLVQILELPKIGRHVLSVMKSISPEKYNQVMFQYNFALSHFLLYIGDKLKGILIRDISLEEVEYISKEACEWGLSYYLFECGYSEEESDQLDKEVNKRIIEYSNLNKIEERILLENILKVLRHQIRPEQVAIFFTETVAKDPLYLIEPLRFIERWKDMRS